MAGKKAATILVKLLSSAGTGFFYVSWPTAALLLCNSMR